MTIDKLNQMDRETRRTAWTGGDVPPVGYYKQSKLFRQLVSFFFQEQLVLCGGLDFGKCAGTGSMERARIFWNRAKLDAWRTMNP